MLDDHTLLRVESVDVCGEQEVDLEIEHARREPAVRVHESEGKFGRSTVVPRSVGFGEGPAGGPETMSRSINREVDHGVHLVGARVEHRFPTKLRAAVRCLKIVQAPGSSDGVDELVKQVASCRLAPRFK